jgi:alpha-glucoside transport system permease protein
MAWFLAVPVVRSLVASFQDRLGQEWVGFDNYIFAFTDPRMLETFRNNLLWLVFGTSFSVALGLLIAVLADRSRAEVIYKSIIFTPMAISFVGAGVIWKFVYTYKGVGLNIQEIGLLNAIVTGLGGTPQPWLNIPPWNNFLLIVIMIWLQTGYAMVILSSAIKGVPAELLEAARIDGASEVRAFFSITIPYIRGTIITVVTTIVIFSLKTFDVVRVMTGGNNGTNVIANEFYLQSFTYTNKGRASAIAIVLLVLVIPIIIYNLRQFNKERKGF